MSLSPTRCPLCLSAPTSQSRNNDQTRCLGEKAPSLQTKSRKAIQRPVTVSLLSTTSYNADIIQYTDMPLFPAPLRYPEYCSVHGFWWTYDSCGPCPRRGDLAMERWRLHSERVNKSIFVVLGRPVVRLVHTANREPQAHRAYLECARHWYHGLSAVV
jgi:hypothetical protein